MDIVRSTLAPAATTNGSPAHTSEAAGARSIATSHDARPPFIA